MEETMKQLRAIYNVLEEKKGEDIQIIDISKVSVMSDYFVIVNGANESHVNALVENVEEKLHRLGYEIRQQEGNRKSGWVLIDCNDIIIHVFDRDSREFYNLERIWGDGKKMDI